MKNDMLKQIFLGVIVAVISILSTLALGANHTMSREEIQTAIEDARHDAQGHANVLEVKLDSIQNAVWAVKVDLEHQRTLLENLGATAHRKGEVQ